MNLILKYFSIPSLIFIVFCLLMIIFLSSILWWEYWGQWIFNKIIIKKEVK